MALIVAVALGLVAAPAHAQTPSEVATAKRWFAEGLASEEKGDFAAALGLFRRASQVKRTPQIVYHVGLCEGRTGALVEALVDLDTAAALARSAGAEKVVVAAEAELATVRARVPSLEVRVGGGERPERLMVDDHSIALSMLGTAMPLDPGAHTVSVAFASGVTVTKPATLVERDAVSLDLTPPASAPSPPVVAVAPRPPLPPPLATARPSTPSPEAPVAASVEPGHRSVLPWLVTGVGGAVTLAGAALIVAARVDLGTVSSGCPSHSGCPLSLQGTYNTATTLNGLGLGLGAAGLATAGVGVTLLALRPTSSTSASLVVSPSSVAVTGRF